MARKAAQAAAIGAHRLNTGSTTGVRQDEDECAASATTTTATKARPGERDPLPDGRI